VRISPWLNLFLLISLLLLPACSSTRDVRFQPGETLLAGETSNITENVEHASPTEDTGSAVPSATILVGTPAPTLIQIPSPTLIASPFPTPTPTFTPTPLPVIRFAVIGDYGLEGQPAADVANLVKSWHPDFILTTGDNNYPLGEAETIDENIGQYYHEYIFPYEGSYGEGADLNRFFPTLGNHDYGSPGALPYLEYFTLPGNERYYDFIWGTVHFFAINSDSNEPDGFRRDSLQANWLKEKLAASEAVWKIVYMHHPPYSSGTHGPIAWIQWPFTDWEASAVISGHDHTYERLQIDGVPYFVNGLGGGPRYEFPSLHPGSQVRYRDDHGAMLVEADEAHLTFRFITRKGQVIDTFKLSR